MENLNELKTGLDNALATGNVEEAKSFWDKIKEWLDKGVYPGGGSLGPNVPKEEEDE